MLISGAHYSTAGGVSNAVRTCVEHESRTLQLFTKNANQWAGKPLTGDDCKAFRDKLAEANVQFPTAHDSYLINLASPDETLWQKSIAAFAEELRRAERLGMTYLVTHPGAHVGSGVEAGLARAVEGYNLALRQSETESVVALFETTAGQGSCLGHRFEHLATLLSGMDSPERFGVCLDTCHVFAAGYDLRTADAYDATMNELDAVIGAHRVLALHVNDSIKGLNCRVDRHAGLGLGSIGLEAFRCLVNDERFAGRPFILETPKEDDDGNEMDPVNLAILRGLAAGVVAA